MYILHRRTKRTRNFAVFVVLVVLAVSGTILGKSFFKTDTTIGPTPAAVVSKVYDTRSAPKHFDEKLFSFDAPHDWEPTTISGAPAGSLSWHNTAENKGVRIITLYMDGSIPPNFAVNRVVALQAADNHLTVQGDVSDNCTNFTSAGRQASGAGGSGTAQAKWQGVSFICDTGNYVRNVVGSGSSGADGLNTIKLTGSTAGTHNLFFTYTDNSASPDFGIFTSMLSSFNLN